MVSIDSLVRAQATLDEPGQRVWSFEDRGDEVFGRLLDRAPPDNKRRTCSIGVNRLLIRGASEHRRPRLFEQAIVLRADFVGLRAQPRELVGFGLQRLSAVYRLLQPPGRCRQGLLQLS